MVSDGGTLNEHGFRRARVINNQEQFMFMSQCPRIPYPHFLFMIYAKVFKQLWTFRTFGASGVQVFIAAVVDMNADVVLV